MSQVDLLKYTLRRTILADSYQRWTSDIWTKNNACVFLILALVCSWRVYMSTVELVVTGKSCQFEQTSQWYPWERLHVIHRYKRRARSEFKRMSGIFVGCATLLNQLRAVCQVSDALEVDVFLEEKRHIAWALTLHTSHVRGTKSSKKKSKTLSALLVKDLVSSDHWRTFDPN